MPSDPRHRAGSRAAGRARPLLATLLLGANALAATALGTLVPAPAVAAERVLHRTGTDDPTTADPHKVAYPGETTVMSDLFVGLTELDARARAAPGCAESWQASADGRTYTFRLRANLRWSDGQPLDARDFEWSLRRALDPGTAFPYAARLFVIRNARAVAAGRQPAERLGVVAVDARTLRIELEHPAPYLPEILATFAMPVPRARVERHGAAWSRPEHFVGNGPFTIAEWVPNSHVRLKRNPYFHDAAAVKLDAVVHYPAPQPMTALRRFRAGEVDLVLSVPADQVEWARREFGAQLRVSQGLGLDALAFNARSGPTRDLRVRRALAMAIDREALARSVLGVPGAAAYGYVAPGVANYPAHASADFAGWPAPRRRAEAMRLLADAGYGPARPLQLRLAFPANDANRRVAVVIDAMWRAVGVRPRLEAREQRVLAADVARGDFDAVRTLWLAGHGDPMSFLERLDGAAAGTTMNPSGYSNPGFDAWVSQAQAEPDLAKRAALLRRAESLALADMPVAPLHWYVARRLVSSRVGGWTDNPRGVHLSRFLSVPSR